MCIINLDQLYFSVITFHNFQLICSHVVSQQIFQEWHGNVGFTRRVYVFIRYKVYIHAYTLYIYIHTCIYIDDHHVSNDMEQIIR